MKTINILIACFNERDNIEKLISEIERVMQPLSESYSYRITFVNDGSTDDTLAFLQSIASTNERIQYISLSRNFNQQSALKAGFDWAKEDAVITMDGDLQHPPQLIPELLRQWEKGYQVVNTIRTYPKTISRTKRFTSEIFHQLFNFLSEQKVREGTADFRLLDRKIVEVIKTLNEEDIFFRGIVPWIGFSQVYVPYQAQMRFSGDTKYSVVALIKLAVRGITSFSVRPLYLAVYLGFLFSSISLLYIPYVIYSLTLGVRVSGWASLIMTVVFFGGVQLFILGIIGIYIGKIFKQVKNRPKYIIQDKKIRQ